MRLLRVSLISVCCFFLFCSPVFADVVWPPPNYEMPRTVLDTVSASNALAGVKLSLGAITNTGVKIMGIVLSFSLIGSIFYGLVFKRLELLRRVRNNEFNREVRAADRKRNMNSIVNDKVGEMEASYLAKKRFRSRHPSIDLEEAIYKRQISSMASFEFNRRSPNLAVESRISNREIGHEAEGVFRYRNSNYVMARKVDDRFISDQAKLRYLNTFPENQEMLREKYSEMARSYRESQGYFSFSRKRK